MSYFYFYNFCNFVFLLDIFLSFIDIVRRIFFQEPQQGVLAFDSLNF